MGSCTTSSEQHATDANGVLVKGQKDEAVLHPTAKCHISEMATGTTPSEHHASGTNDSFVFEVNVRKRPEMIKCLAIEEE